MRATRSSNPQLQTDPKKEGHHICVERREDKMMRTPNWSSKWRTPKPRRQTSYSGTRLRWRHHVCVNNPSSIHTYDFSTLYTNLPLDLVRNELFEMIDRYFDINERKSNKYIVLNHFWETAQFASVNKKGSYDRDKLKTALDYLLFNSFVRFGPHVFKQIKGIPMGGNASPLIADLFLANLEFKYMDKLVSSKSPENLRMAKKLR